MQIYILIGSPSSGKGTQAKLLKEKLNLPHISTGEMFRKEIDNKTELGQKIQHYVRAGKFAPNHITSEVLKKRISELDCESGLILDGYPRTLLQAEYFHELMLDKNITIKAVIYYKVTDEIAVQRIKGRAQQAILKGNKARADDLDENTIRARLEEYHHETHPILKFYKKQGILLKIDASNSIEEIFKDSLRKLEQKDFLHYDEKTDEKELREAWQEELTKALETKEE